MPDRNQTMIVPDGKGQWLSWLGRPNRCMVTGDDTGGTYALSWTKLSPGSGVPPHRHTFSEGFYVLRGKIQFVAGKEMARLGPGGFIGIGGGTAHSFGAIGPDEAEMLVLVAPAGFERFQAEVGRKLADGSGPFEPPTPDDLARMRELAPAYGIELDLPSDAFTVEPDVVIRRAGQGPAFAVVGDLYTFLAEGEHTGGRYGLWHAVVPPGGGPPPHIQSREFEGFYVLDGEMTFRADGKSYVAGPGTVVNVPPGSVHSFRNESDRPATQLIWVAPAGLEQMFRETGRPAEDRSVPVPPPTPDEIERVLAVAPKYGVTVFPPGGH